MVFSLEALICRRILGGLVCGGGRTDVLAVLGPPDQWTGHAAERSPIWRYGRFEVHFDSDIVYMFFIDDLDELDPGPGRTIDQWILSRMTNRTWGNVIAALQSAPLHYELKQDRIGRPFVRVVGGSDLGFDEDPRIGGGRWNCIAAYPLNVASEQPNFLTKAGSSG